MARKNREQKKNIDQKGIWTEKKEMVVRSTKRDRERDTHTKHLHTRLSFFSTIRKKYRIEKFYYFTF